jgi:hypothetical protein
MAKIMQQSFFRALLASILFETIIAEAPAGARLISRLHRLHRHPELKELQQ